jgi:hypothetical protein
MPDLKLKADVVLQDCKNSLLEYNLQLQSEKLRIRWICIVTLLRAVGHVLQNVDMENRDEKLKAIIKCKFDEINNHKEKYPIYWKFIKAERDRFLKQYEHGIVRILRPKPGIRRIGFSSTSDVSRNRGVYLPPSDTDEIVSFLSSGPYKGKYEKDIAEEAYKWWETIISEIRNEYEHS